MVEPWVSLLILLALHGSAHAAVTVYGIGGVQNPTGSQSGSLPISTLGSTEWTSALGAWNDIQLQAPPLPVPLPPTAFTVALANQAEHVTNLSIPQRGDFYGFSIETSVVEQVSNSFIQVPFLNLLATVADRAGSVRVRVGGNSQETATLVGSLPNNSMIEKAASAVVSNSRTYPKCELLSTAQAQIPALIFTDELLYLLNNVSHLVSAKWYLGIPMNDTSHLRLQIAEQADAILGDNVLGYQVGNEPDLYATHGSRPPTYGVQDYFNEFGTVVDGLKSDQKITEASTKLVAPSFQGKWKAEDLWATGYLNAYAPAIKTISFEHYADNNCAAEFPDGGFGAIKNPQDVFPEYLTHANGQKMVAPYLNSAALAQQFNKEFMMFETNSASCGGFPGVSDSFGSALWAVDYGLQLAYSNFTGAMLHIGGSNVTYNVSPPTNISLFQKFTVGPTMYSTLFMAEALGKTNTSRVVDLTTNEFTPVYGIYEHDTLARVALVNFMTEQNGVGSYQATISIGGGLTGEPNATPASVKVKFTFGPRFQVDGRLIGQEIIKEIPCDQTANTCTIPVPAPGAALVFLSSDAQNNADSVVTQTYSTTSVTNRLATATLFPSAIAQSNGHRGADFPLSGTSQGGETTAKNLPPASLQQTVFIIWARAMMVFG
ncbi:hypothetical protein BD310DRAFT_947603 [Dichomitus squalens]|uniref:Beta-glucuronidase C-terminal domain-containing protein n=1 Tax=Dichomitus squalens TaxID=114155 RepID=A0A4Q9PZA4_9APHY|nr:hypothetical protein BD310DRAFT_947603 [Dichomitus squalens]